MPLPLFLGIAAGVGAVTGAGAAIFGGAKIKKASDTMKATKVQHEKNITMFEEKNLATTKAMDELGRKELEILKGFEKFSELLELIQNRPEFKAYQVGGVQIPSYDPQELQTASVGAGVLLGGLGGAALGTAGGFAAAGATTAAVMALGTASTGTAIASLSGVAATNATLAALGGGALSVGGGGMALGATVLSSVTAGMAILVGGIVFSITGQGLSKKADKAKQQMLDAQREIKRVCNYLDFLGFTEKKFEKSLMQVNKVYQRHFAQLRSLIFSEHKINWAEYSNEEKLLTENTVLLVNLLFQMCKVKLVLKDEMDFKSLNTINERGVQEAVDQADRFLDEKGLRVA